MPVVIHHIDFIEIPREICRALAHIIDAVADRPVFRDGHQLMLHQAAGAVFGLGQRLFNQRPVGRRQPRQDAGLVCLGHILEEVDAVCTRAIIITHGKVVFDGTPSELKERSPSGRLDEVFREITTAAEPVKA